MKKILLILISCTFFLSGCNKWLDVDLADKVTDEKLFSTAQGYQEALAGVYSAMADSAMYGAKLTMEETDLLAQYYSYDGVSTNYENFKNYNYPEARSQTRILESWKNLYAAIAGANNIIAWATKDTKVLSPDLKDQVLGEAYAMRGYLHLDLIRLFCPDVKRLPKATGIPYNLHFGVALPPMYTVEEAVQLVVNDLRDAEKFLAKDPITTVKPYLMANKNEADKYVARLNYYGVKALLARVSLMRGDKVSAVKYATEVVESGAFKLLDFASIDKSDKEVDMLFSDEHIFSLRKKPLSDYSISLHYQLVDERGGTTPAKLPFANLSQIYENNNDDIRYIKWFSTTNRSFVKFNIDNKDKFFPKMPMIKLSEMYLILAECHLGSDDQKAYHYINTLRDHRIRNNSHWSYLTMDYIMQEMRREFVGEGQLWYAYKRLNLGIPTSNGIIGTVPPSEQVFVFPIPLKEMETGNRN
ncbi:RagB/SusD family nutrient uptake outer membrane protein [Sphingobacterium psychroaquaticum]|uniref:SusD family protein n=1 Tax=Sphingobacterium psychroaquaticum TaxID=561061 RepID=A0A1X7LBU3_9SPHI|nr:RagB/SusD family nutrient uptake outer membrane protein [Sphingobacterium psychroaquaticum]SMG51225.1 SusD family protein [Sphingobacterium psychroaquaticum]